MTLTFPLTSPGPRQLSAPIKFYILSAEIAIPLRVILIHFAYLLEDRFRKSTYISMILSVTHLRSYTNSAIAGNSAPISPESADVFASSADVFASSADIVASNGECFVMFHNALRVFHDVLLCLTMFYDV